MSEVFENIATPLVIKSGDAFRSAEKITISEQKGAYIFWKYAFDYLVAFVLLILMAPLLGMIALAIKIESSGPVFFKHRRIGLRGESFEMYKFRTMVDGAHLLQDKFKHLNEMKGGNLFKSDNDPRITRIGKFLRETSLDELPQFFNIIKGEMTLIGPRAISTPLNKYKPDELIRFSIKPGLGCIWQAYFRGQTDFRYWMKTDIIYTQNLSPSLDFKLFFKIAQTVFLKKGAR